MISVSISSPGETAVPGWDDLTQRSSSNVFMNPAALSAARETGFSKIHLMMAWADDGAAKKLVGVWALQVRKIAFFWPALLEALPFNYAFLSSPVVDPAFIELVIPAFFAAVKRAKTLPNVINLKDLDGDSASYPAIVKSLTAQGADQRLMQRYQRPVAGREVGIKKSGSTRKKLRQDWNRLSALGVLDIVNDRAPNDVARAFEAFLALEAKSWKGQQGTALLCDQEDAAFVRRLSSALATKGCASVALLRLDGEPIATQVLMYCGSTAYTWKTAYDAGYAKYSPGALLIDRLTQEMFATPGIETIDSCSAEGSFMAQLWTGRRTMVDMLVDVGGKRSWAFRVESLRQRGREALKRLRDRLVAWRADRLRKPPLPVAAVTAGFDRPPKRRRPTWPVMHVTDLGRHMPVSPPLADLSLPEQAEAVKRSNA